MKMRCCFHSCPGSRALRGLPRCGRRALNPASFPEPSALPSQAALPDPLVMFDGRRVTSRDQWFKERRPELKALFQHYMYGAIPPKPAHVQVKVARGIPRFPGREGDAQAGEVGNGPHQRAAD